ncbi:MAG: hypothetical protein ACYCUG_12860, partial [Acidimicrobiales bacterium]
APAADVGPPTGTPVPAGGDTTGPPVAPDSPPSTAGLPPAGLPIAAAPPVGAPPVGTPNGTSAASSHGPAAPGRAAGEAAGYGEPTLDAPPSGGGVPSPGSAQGRGEDDTGGRTADMSGSDSYAAPPPPEDNYDEGPDEEALDNFFHGDEYGDDRRFGGRLRRRR